MTSTTTTQSSDIQNVAQPTPDPSSEEETPTSDVVDSSAVASGVDAPAAATETEDKSKDDDESTKEKSEPDENALSSKKKSEDLMTARTNIMIESRRLAFDYDESPGESVIRGLDMVTSLLQYLNSLESRIQSLPNDKNKDEDKKDTKSTDGDEKAPSLSWHFFKADKEFDLDGRLVGMNDDELAHSNRKEPNVLIRAVYSWAEDAGDCAPKLSPGECPKPEQTKLIALAIYSEPIARFFEKELGFDNVNHDIVRIGIPFRPLLRNLQAIREHTERLQQRFSPNLEGTNPPQTDKDVAENESPEEDDNLPFAEGVSGDETRETDSYNRVGALEQFQLLLDFVDQYLSKEINLYRRLTSGHGEKVAFKDLWMLFDTGVTIYSPAQEGGVEIPNSDEDESPHITKRRHLPQAYRVSATAGGIPLSKSLAPRYRETQLEFRYGDNYIDRALLNPMEIMRPDATKANKRRSKYSPLNVMCFYVDFDGVKFGTVTEIFVFKPYAGEIDIRALEAYPIEYHEAVVSQHPEEDVSEPRLDGHLSVDALIKRGRKFIDVTPPSHMLYDSLTVGGATREEINSEIMIDFRTAFEEYRESFRASKPVVPEFNSLTAFWPSTGTGEFFEFYGSCSDKEWCQSSCIKEMYSSNQKRQQEQMESKIKTLIEESGLEKVHQEQDYENLKAYMEEHDLLQLLPGVVPGYALRHRKWVQLDLTLLEPVKQENGWDRLVLPKGHRQMVQAMVETHAKSSRAEMFSREKKTEMDLVRGKGKGCIILLHGAPGVGKTSTAECVASYTRRPLYPITCGDIGYLPESVEKNMEEHFKLARRWGCVLLLDEADVFLAKRTKSDVKRNGLVSVFLRILEYYTGILFLTTNRVGAIDDAFRSRLHLTLFYPKLERKETIKIWKTNFKRLEANNEQRAKNGQPIIDYDKKKILHWSEKHYKKMQWNGRQIRNAFQTAIALAEFQSAHSREESEASSTQNKAPTIDTGLFRLIANASIQFTEYLALTHGIDEDTTASRDQVRLKSYQEDPKLRIVEDSEDSSASDSSSESSSLSSGSSSDESDEDDAKELSDKSSSDSGSESSDSSKKSKKKKSKKKSKTSDLSKDEKKKKEKEKEKELKRKKREKKKSTKV